MTAIIGIDPGTKGAVAIVSKTGSLIGVEDMPTVDGWVSATLLAQRIAAGTEHYDVALAVVEAVRSMPKQGVASTFKFATAYGIALGCCAGYPMENPRPHAWKKAMGLSSDKDRSRAMAIDLWPGHAGLFERKKDADRAEAALLAEYGRRLLVERGQA